MVSSVSYATAAEFKTRMKMNTSDDDAYIAALIAACSRAIDGFCNRPDGFEAADTATAREYGTPQARYVFIDECATITEVAYKNSVTATSYTALASNNWQAFRGNPKKAGSVRFGVTPYHGVMLLPNASIGTFVSGRYSQRTGFSLDLDNQTGDEVYVPTVRVTAKWGYAATTPETVREACIMQSIRWYKRFSGGMGDSHVSAEMGEQRFVKKLDPDVEFILTQGRLRLPALGVR